MTEPVTETMGGVVRGHLQSVGRRPRVVLLAEQRLVGDAVRTALTSRHLDVVSVPWPDARHPTTAVRRALTSVRANAGIVFGDLVDPRRRAHARMLVATVPLRWVLVVSDQEDLAWGDLVDVGATLVPTWISLEELTSGLVRLMSGVDLMTPDARQRMVREWREQQDVTDEVTDRLNLLTPREAEVLRMLSSGLSVRQIAARRGVAEATVRTQVKAVLRKLEVRSQLAAVALAARASPGESAGVPPLDLLDGHAAGSADRPVGQ